jgi:hypothetical protein
MFLLLFWSTITTFLYALLIEDFVWFVNPCRYWFLIRRRGISNRTTRIMLSIDVINFILFSISIWTKLSAFIIFNRKALIETTNVPLLERLRIVDDALYHNDLIYFWAANLPVSPGRLPQLISPTQLSPIANDL